MQKCFGRITKKYFGVRSGKIEFLTEVAFRKNQVSSGTEE